MAQDRVPVGQGQAEGGCLGIVRNDRRCLVEDAPVDIAEGRFLQDIIGQGFVSPAVRAAPGNGEVVDLGLRRPGDMLLDEGGVPAGVLPQERALFRAEPDPQVLPRPVPVAPVPPVVDDPTITGGGQEQQRCSKRDRFNGSTAS